jgi:hypothetical protein
VDGAEQIWNPFEHFDQLERMMMRFGFTITTLTAFLILAGGSIRYIKANPAPRLSSNDTTRTPVLVELFTSEGCSSCPPADALLEKLDRSQPISGAELIVLSEHVDYWNDIGWKDPYSSREYSERQSAYAAQFGLGGIYTPQMVVDGRYELVGSDEQQAIRAVEKAVKVEKIQLMLSLFHTEDPNKLGVRVETGPLPSSLATKSANVFLAVADESDESRVTRGENAGRTLKHVAVLRDLVPVGKVSRTENFSRNVTLNLDIGNRRDLRIVGIIQEPAAGRVLGAGSVRLSN